MTPQARRERAERAREQAQMTARAIAKDFPAYGLYGIVDHVIDALLTFADHEVQLRLAGAVAALERIARIDHVGHDDAFDTCREMAEGALHVLRQPPAPPEKESA